MNYLSEILAFHDFRLTNELSTSQSLLWYELMYINNKCAWAEWFSAPNQVLELYTGLSRQGITIARNVLKQKGLIDFRTNGTKSTQYKMISMSYFLQDCLQDRLQDSLQGCLQDRLQDSCTLNKQNETKQNNNIYNIILPLRDGEFDVPDRLVDEFKKIYPGKDIEGELLKMRGWLISNPSKRKTRKGITRFINGWLSRGDKDADTNRACKEARNSDRGDYGAFGTVLDV
jgi:hypothetical protein